MRVVALRRTTMLAQKKAVMLNRVFRPMAIWGSARRWADRGARTLGATVVCVVVLGGVSAAAAFDVQGLIAARIGHFKEMGRAAKGLQEEVKKPNPDVATIQGYAQRLDELAEQLPGWFPLGSGPESGVKTDAKPEIWSRAAEFRKSEDAFSADGRALRAAAGQGPGPSLAASVNKFGADCKSCHQQFRLKHD